MNLIKILLGVVSVFLRFNMYFQYERMEDIYSPNTMQSFYVSRTSSFPFIMNEGSFNSSLMNIYKEDGDLEQDSEIEDIDLIDEEFSEDNQLTRNCEKNILENERNFTKTIINKRYNNTFKILSHKKNFITGNCRKIKKLNQEFEMKRRKVIKSTDENNTKSILNDSNLTKLNFESDCLDTIKKKRLKNISSHKYINLKLKSKLANKIKCKNHRQKQLKNRFFTYDIINNEIKNRTTNRKQYNKKETNQTSNKITRYKNIIAVKDSELNENQVNNETEIVYLPLEENKKIVCNCLTAENNKTNDDISLESKENNNSTTILNLEKSEKINSFENNEMTDEENSKNISLVYKAKENKLKYKGISKYPKINKNEYKKLLNDTLSLIYKEIIKHELPRINGNNFHNLNIILETEIRSLNDRVIKNIGKPPLSYKKTFFYKHPNLGKLKCELFIILLGKRRDMITSNVGRYIILLNILLIRSIPGENRHSILKINADKKRILECKNTSHLDITALGEKKGVTFQDEQFTSDFQDKEILSSDGNKTLELIEVNNKLIPIKTSPLEKIQYFITSIFSNFYNLAKSTASFFVKSKTNEQEIEEKKVVENKEQNNTKIEGSAIKDQQASIPHEDDEKKTKILDKPAKNEIVEKGESYFNRVFYNPIESIKSFFYSKNKTDVSLIDKNNNIPEKIIPSNPAGSQELLIKSDTHKNNQNDQQSQSGIINKGNNNDKDNTSLISKESKKNEKGILTYMASPFKGLPAVLGSCISTVKRGGASLLDVGNAFVNYTRAELASLFSGLHNFSQEDEPQQENQPEVEIDADEIEEKRKVFLKNLRSPPFNRTTPFEFSTESTASWSEDEEDSLPEIIPSLRIKRSRDDTLTQNRKIPPKNKNMLKIDSQKKRNKIMWILGILLALISLCCVGFLLKSVFRS